MNVANFIFSFEIDESKVEIVEFTHHRFREPIPFSQNRQIHEALARAGKVPIAAQPNFSHKLVQAAEIGR